MSDCDGYIAALKPMSVKGLGRVKTPFQGSRSEARTGSVSGRDRSHQRLGPDDVHDPCQVIGEDREGHLGGDFRKRFGQEVRRPHAGLDRSERMFDRLATLAHGLWVCIEALLPCCGCW